jgi:predicted metalloprotease with PDZ domain
MPYDWSGFLTTRLTEKAKGAPLGGFERSGYKLTYTDTPTPIIKLAMKVNKTLDLSWSLGLSVGKGAKVTAVVWGGPAYDAGVTVGHEIVAVGGVPYTDDILKDAVTAAKGGTAPIRLTVKNDLNVRDVNVKWNGGMRYPRFEKTGKGDGALDRLLAARP